MMQVTGRSPDRWWTWPQTWVCQTVAEGIETPEQQEILRELGCVFGQGFMYSRPVLAEEIPALVRSIQEKGYAAPPAEQECCRNASLQLVIRQSDKPKALFSVTQAPQP